MAEKKNLDTERAAEIYRNVNAATAAGAGVLAVAANAELILAPEAVPVLIAVTAWNVAQAGLGEVVRRWRKKSKKSSTAAVPVPA